MDGHRAPSKTYKPAWKRFRRLPRSSSRQVGAPDDKASGRFPPFFVAHDSSPDVSFRPTDSRSRMHIFK